jgi:hypothetical protein
VNTCEPTVKTPYSHHSHGPTIAIGAVNRVNTPSSPYTREIGNGTIIGTPCIYVALDLTFTVFTWTIGVELPGVSREHALFTAGSRVFTTTAGGAA